MTELFKQQGFNVSDIDTMDTSKYSLDEWLSLIERLVTKPDVKYRVKSSKGDFLYVCIQIQDNLLLKAQGKTVRFELINFNNVNEKLLSSILLINICLKKSVEELPLLLSYSTPEIIKEFILWRIDIGK